MFTKVSEMHSRNTRNSANNMLFVPNTPMELSKGNVKYRGATYFNYLPYEVKEAPNYEAFKRQSKGVDFAILK